MDKIEPTTDEMIALLPALSEQDKKIILLTGINAHGMRNGESAKLGINMSQLKGRQAELRKYFGRVIDACNKLGVFVTSILCKPLDAPVEVLGMSVRTRNALRRENFELERVSDFYREKITTEVLEKISGIGPMRMMQLNEALKRINLPELSQSDTDSLIYRFHDAKYASRLTNKEKIVLKLKRWSMMGDDDISNIYNIPADQMLDFIKRAEYGLMEM